MSNPTRSELRRAIETSIEILSSPDIAGSLSVREISAVATSHGPVLLGLDADARPHLLLAIDPARPAIAQPSGAGVTATRRSLTHGSQGFEFVDVVCLLPRLRGLFGLLCTDLLERLVPNPEDAEATVRATLDDWRTLVARAREPLTESRARGLFGELYELDRLVSLSPRAIQFWCGPEAGEHDLRSGSRAIEVKSRARRGTLLEINGIGQLEPPKGGLLGLVVLVVATSLEGTSLRDMLNRVADRLTDPSLLWDRVALLGIDPTDPSLEAHRFEVLEDHMYSVGPEFPRLVHSDLVQGHLHPAIRALSYVVDIASAPSPMSDADARRYREEFLVR